MANIAGAKHRPVIVEHERSQSLIIYDSGCVAAVMWLQWRYVDMSHPDCNFGWSRIRADASCLDSSVCQIPCGTNLELLAVDVVVHPPHKRQSCPILHQSWGCTLALSADCATAGWTGQLTTSMLVSSCTVQ
jgi:hypothetical protein